jgi:hypothetical protein
VKRYPQWFAGAGDILRVMKLFHQLGINVPIKETHEWLLKGFTNSAGCFTAYGFASQGNQKKPPDIPDFLDILPVCGWVDKAFRYLASCISGIVEFEPEKFNVADLRCHFRGRPARYYEDEKCIRVRKDNELLYCWEKAKNWAATDVVFG